MAVIEEQDKIIKIIGMFFPTAKIYLFGSYARGDQRQGSDIDIAIDNEQTLPIIQHSQIKGMIECLNLVQNVDVVDFQALPENMQSQILKEGIVWKS